MKQEVIFLLEIIKSLLNNCAIEVTFDKSQLDWKWLLSFAKKHSILNVLCYGIEKLPKEYKPNEEISTYLIQQVMQTVAVSVNQVEAANEIEELFEKNGIFLVAVKGVCTKKRYPQQEMRTMGDIDLLYHASQKSEVKQAMLSLGYEDSEEGRKHDSFFKPPYITVEMHRELLAPDSKYSKYYKNIWERLELKKDHKHVYKMSVEDEYIYTILHLVEHFQNGGVGIRFIMDIYVYDQIKEMNWMYVEAELRSLGLLEFYKNISQLAKMWFGNEKECHKSELTQELERYIITNGIYGTSYNAASTVAQKGKMKFILKTIFPNLENMKSMFPWLEKWPILLPYSWILRGLRSVLYRKKNIKIQFDKCKQGDVNHGKALQLFYKKCGL